MTRIVFLDIDGVLNDVHSNRYMPSPWEDENLLVGIDEDKLQNLKYIIDKTGAEIYLTSTWKENWHKYQKDLQDAYADEIDKRFATVGLKVTNRTYDGLWKGRGDGIKHVLITLDPAPEGWVILDDEVFSDYIKLNLISHLVQTDWEGNGLNRKNAELAIKVLNNEIIVECEEVKVSDFHWGK